MATKKINIDGMNKGQAMETLIKGGLSFGDAEAHWAQNGSKRGGFRSKMYEAFLKQDFSKDALLTYIKKNGGSANDEKNLNSYLAISELVTRAKALNA